LLITAISYFALVIVPLPVASELSDKSSFVD
jgi:hypothetical protein